MRRELLLTFAVLVPMAFPLACGGLEEGEIVIVDGEAGAGAVTGGTPNAGKGGTVSGGRGGRGGRGGSGEAGIGAAGADGGSNPSGGSAGSSTGGSSSGDTGYSGSAGATPTDCADHYDCGVAAPICDDGQCRRCSAGNECRARDGATPYCGTGGRCLECTEASHCTDSSKPFCGPAGVCRGCEENSDCPSEVCVAGGQCALEASVVYARAVDGYPVADCGTQTRPCAYLADTESKLSATRQYLVLMSTTESFSAGMKLPANTNVVVIGNHVTVSTYNEPAFIVNGGDVVFREVVAETQGDPPLAANLSAVQAQGGKLTVIRSSFGNLADVYDATGMRLTDTSAIIRESKFHGSRTGLVSHSSPGLPAATLTVERSLFESNTQALDFNGASFVIRNNLFLRNGQTAYVRIIKLQKVTTGVFSYNTMVGNDNYCNYEGGLVVCEGPSGSCGTLSSNISWGNMYNGSGGTPCPDQVYENPPLLYYTIHEPRTGTMEAWPGTGIITSDPLFVNPGNDNYTPGDRSPAIGKGDTQADVVPEDDYYGNPRPQGDLPDIGAIEAE